MSNLGSLEEAFRKKEEERNKELLQIVSESLNSFRSELTTLFEREGNIIKSDIPTLAANYIKNFNILRRLNLREWFIRLGLTIVGISLGVMGLLYYISLHIESQIKQIESNHIYLETQQRAIESRTLKLENLAKEIQQKHFGPGKSSDQP